MSSINKLVKSFNTKTTDKSSFFQFARNFSQHSLTISIKMQQVGCPMLAVHLVHAVCEASPDIATSSFGLKTLTTIFNLLESSS